MSDLHDVERGDGLHECARRLTWAGGTHVFNLANDTVLSIIAGVPCPMQTALLKPPYVCSAKSCLDGQFGDTPAAALKRFEHGVYSVADVETIIELGLFGGGEVNAREAVDLVDKHVRGRALGPECPDRL